MKFKLIAASVLVVAGIGFLLAGQQFAQPAHAAAGGSIIEVVFAGPALVFTFAGAAALVVAVIGAVVVLAETNNPRDR